MLSKSLRYFLAVARLNSINLAAASMHVVPSAVSRQIQKLEAQEGVLLFDRQTTGMELTAAGKVLFSFAQDMDARLKLLSGDLVAAHLGSERPIKIASVESFSREYLPGMLGRNRSHDPQNRFELIVDSPSDVELMVRSGEVDVGLTRSFGPIDGVRTEVSFDEKLCAVVRPGHFLASRPALTLAEIACCDVAMHLENTTTRKIVDSLCVASGVTLAPTFTSNSSTSLFRYVQSCDAVAFAAPPSVSRLLSTSQLKAIPLAGLSSCTRAAHVITPLALKAKGVRLTRFLAFLLEDMASHYNEAVR